MPKQAVRATLRGGPLCSCSMITAGVGLSSTSAWAVGRCWRWPMSAARIAPCSRWPPMERLSSSSSIAPAVSCGRPRRARTLERAWRTARGGAARVQPSLPARRVSRTGPVSRTWWPRERGRAWVGLLNRGRVVDGERATPGEAGRVGGSAGGPERRLERAAGMGMMLPVSGHRLSFRTRAPSSPATVPRPRPSRGRARRDRALDAPVMASRDRVSTESAGAEPKGGPR